MNASSAELTFTDADRDPSLVTPTLKIQYIGGAAMRDFMQERPEEPSKSTAEYTPTPETDYGTLVELRRIPDFPEGIYNVAAWPANNGQTILLGRHPENPGAQGQPDAGPLELVIFDSKNKKVLSNRQMWRPEAGREGDQLEDVRTIVTPHGDVVLGLTRLVFNPKTGIFEPFPAVAITSNEALLRGEFPDTYLIKEFGKGDSTTPIDKEANRLRLLSGKNITPLGSNTFMFRRETDNHRLTVFSVDEKRRVQKLQNLVFPEDQIPWWGKRRMGTTMPPVQLNQANRREWLLLVHGQVMAGKLKYYIGSSRLFIGNDGQYAIDNISPEPLIGPDSFTRLFPGEQIELHPDKETVYMDGGTTIYDKTGKLQWVHGFPSGRDRLTAEAIFNVPEITRNWKRLESELAVAA